MNDFETILQIHYKKIMNILKEQTISSDCMAAAEQTARSGTKLSMLFIPLLTIVLSVVLLAACGGGGGGSGGGGGGPDTDEDGIADSADACPDGDTGWTSAASTDLDSDGCRDAGEDLDDNNNALIEIDTLDDLARLRDDLNGDGTDDGNIDEITSVGSAGCPSSGCNGYELTRALNFSDAASYAAGSGQMAAWTNRSGNGWVPIGFCPTSTNCTAYTGTFDGGGHTLANLFISANNNVRGVGLFGALTGSIQNLHLLDANVRASDDSVGLLAGFGENARYEDLSVVGGSVNVSSQFAGLVGALVGDGQGAMIRSVSVSGVNVFSGSNDVGGLVGIGRGAMIHAVSVSGVTVSAAGNNAGGLAGSGNNAMIRAAFVSDTVVAGRSNVGGLTGSGENAEISYSYVIGGTVSDADTSGFGSAGTGGLVGFGEDTNIRFSYTAGGSVSGMRAGNIGGLIGSIGFQGETMVDASYWNTETTGQLTSATSNAGDDLGMGLTTVQLRSPTGFTGIYAAWGNFWCDPDTGDVMESTTAPASSFVRVWDLGTSSQYPALNCLPVSVEQQRQ